MAGAASAALSRCVAAHVSERKERKVRQRQVEGVSDPPGVPSGSPQVDGEGRGENDAQ